MRRAANLDRNHADIVNALEAIGAKVQSLAPMGRGIPDLLVGYHQVNVILEVKNEGDPPSRQVLTAAEQKWHATWPGQVSVVYTPQQAQQVVIATALHWHHLEEKARERYGSSASHG